MSKLETVSAVRELADRYVDQSAVLDPIFATSRGVTGHDAEMTDYSPDGHAARAALDRTTLAQLSQIRPLPEPDRMAADVMRERLQVAIDQDQAGERLRDLRVIGSPFQSIRECFDLMATATDADWEVIAARMERVPQALASFESALREGQRRGVVAARRQALVCADQGATWSGQKTARPFFETLAAKSDARGMGNATLQRRLIAAARRASEAYAQTTRFLRQEYAPAAAERDAVGPERYTLWARAFLGTAIDLDETYRWAWDELHRIEDRMVSVAGRILPGEALPAVVHLLETDPARSIEGVDAFRDWLQALMDRTIAELDGAHFDIPEPVKRVEAMIAPPGGAAAMYYTRPSEDFKRPGRTWYPTLGKTRFPLWGEVSTAYHEGVPGHHLQLAQLTYRADELNRFQRVAAFVPGYSEGWALYAERLMGELGYLQNPAYELGMLRAQAFRAMRVVVDIGVHVGLKIPANEAYHPAETWSPELMLPFAIEHGHHPEDFLRSEVDRYLGWPGQAICYKVGERAWLAVREQAREREGTAFNLKAFHTRALDLGPMGLAQLGRELGSEVRSV
ncbi:MAG: DUF885 domain-containing protein [Chloroflexi bacterium]|nr:MAG: DUF885 domain-containing protein [Chloroflexota bacterium]